MTAPTLPNPAADPAGFIRAVADLREQRIANVRHFDGPWIADADADGTARVLYDAGGNPLAGHLAEVADYGGWTLAEHFAAESNPDHATTEVALWREVIAAEGSFGVAYRPVVAATVAACQAYVAWSA